MSCEFGCNALASVRLRDIDTSQPRTEFGVGVHINVEQHRCTHRFSILKCDV